MGNTCQTYVTHIVDTWQTHGRHMGKCLWVLIWEMVVQHYHLFCQGSLHNVVHQVLFLFHYCSVAVLPIFFFLLLNGCLSSTVGWLGFLVGAVDLGLSVHMVFVFPGDLLEMLHQAVL